MEADAFTSVAKNSILDLFFSGFFRHVLTLNEDDKKHQLHLNICYLTSNPSTEILLFHTEGRTCSN